MKFQTQGVLKKSQIASLLLQNLATKQTMLQIC